MKDPIQDTIQRTQRYWYSDGANEIGMGIMFSLLALSFFILGRVNLSGNQELIVGILQPVIIIAGFLLINRLVRLFKDRITYPRTGYVSYQRRSTKRRLTAAFISGGIAAMLAASISIVADHLGVEILPIISGALIAAAIVYLGIRFGLIRFYVLAAFIFICGSYTTFSGVHGVYSSALFFGSMGAGWMLSGLWALIRYLRSTCPPDEEVQE